MLLGKSLEAKTSWYAARGFVDILPAGPRQPVGPVEPVNGHGQIVAEAASAACPAAVMLLLFGGGVDVADFWMFLVWAGQVPLQHVWAPAANYRLAVGYEE